MGKLSYSISKIKEKLFASCCAIKIDGVSKCTGWVASETLIVSVGHVFSNYRNTQSISAHFVSGNEYNLEVVYFEYNQDPLIDYAILQTTGRRITETPLLCTKEMLLSGAYVTCGHGKTFHSLSHAEGVIIGSGQ